MLLTLSSLICLLPAPPALHQGPFLGHVGHDSAHLWARGSAEGAYELRVGETVLRATAEAASDLTLRWALDGLTPSTRYTFELAPPAGEAVQGSFTTAPLPDADGSVRIAFGSCAREDDATAATWSRVEAEKPDAVVLLGDTPYIDKTELVHQRARYAAFASFEPMARVLRTTPWYATWDDHDFGRNDTDGRLAGQERSRQAFVEYHPPGPYGDGERGIYSSFRRGGVEVFLLDTRTFAATEPSPVMAHRASLLGAAQWRWLKERLATSTAPVKVLACGMIWNGSVRPGKLDHWGSYPHERDALFDFIGAQRIGGVVLVGGDIHRSRVIIHEARESAGYDLTELIVSPMHASVIEAANQPHPGLQKDMGEPQTFLTLDVEQLTGKASRAAYRFVGAGGQIHFEGELSW